MHALVLSGGGGRGAYELGVYKAFTERDHPFDILSGTSVGAITAAAIGCGKTMDELEEMWRRMHAFRVMQPRGDFWRMGSWTHLMYSKPLYEFIVKEIDFRALARSEVEVRAAAVDIGTGDLRVFTNTELTPKRLLASASIPLLFPIVEDDGNHYWDGATVVNTPLRPAIEAGATEITAVLLSPVGARAMPPPPNFWDAVNRLADLRLLGQLKEDIKHAEFINELIAKGLDEPGWRHVDFHIVNPHDPLGVTTIFNFDGKLAGRLIRRGYEDGIAHLDHEHPEHRVEERARQELREGLARQASHTLWEDIPGVDP